MAQSAANPGIYFFTSCRQNGIIQKWTEQGMKRRPATYVIHVRMALTDFATICSAYAAAGISGITAGGTARLAIEDFAEILRNTGRGRTFSDIEEANNYLEDVGVKKQGRSVSVARAVMAEMGDFDLGVNEDIVEEPRENLPTVEEVLRRLEGLDE